MAGLETRPRQRITLSTSLWHESRLYWQAITSCPSARSVGISLLKHEPSAQIPWQKTMLGLLCGDIFILSVVPEVEQELDSWRPRSLESCDCSLRAGDQAAAVEESSAS